MTFPSRRLLIMRHADAEAGGAGSPDIDRQLTDLGRVQAARRRDAVAAAAPQAVLCSSATRAVQTLEELGPMQGEVTVDEAFYTATATSLLLHLAGLPDHVSCAMVVGHLPTVGELTDALLGTEGPRSDFPPSTIVTLEFAEPWRQLRPGSARVASTFR